MLLRRSPQFSRFCAGRHPWLFSICRKANVLLLVIFTACQICAPIASAQSDGRKEATPTWTPNGATHSQQADATPTWTSAPVISTPALSAPTPTWTITAPAAPPATVVNLPTAEFTTTPLPTAVSLPTAAPANANNVQNAADRLFISEFMANPAAVGDAQGEFVEIWNGDTVPINLRGWILADLDSDSHTIGTDLFIAPNEYVILGRNADPSVNGSLPVDYVLSGTQLANGGDELLLHTPDGTEVDRVIWGGSSALSTTAGASLERTDPADPNTWQTASTPWLGSLGDFGSPGGAYGVASDPPTATTIPTATAVITTVVTATPIISATILPPITPTATVPFSPTQLIITEFMANPAVVADGAGEFIELYNPGSVPINLNGWTIADEDSDQHTITIDLFVMPGDYFVLARNGDAAANGGVVADYVYSGMNLANGEDELIIYASDGTLIGRVIWGGTSGLSITAGASLERMMLGEPALWITAQSQWPGSLGDLGSPGGAYVPPAPTSTPMVTPTGIAVPTATVDPVLTPVIAPTTTPATTPVASPIATDTGPSGPWPSLTITEIMANPAAVGDADGEFFEIYNPGPGTVNLAGWQIGDLGSDQHTIVGELLIPAGGYAVLARNGDATLNGGIVADYVYSGMSLANGSDELILFASDGTEIERVIWGDGSALQPSAGASFERLPGGEATWQTATVAWPGSAGDLGSPGLGATPATVTTATPSAPSGTPAHTATPSPVPTLAPTLSAFWEVAPDPSAVQIEEVAFRGSDEEFVALLNVGDATADLSVLLVGDAQVPGAGEGVYSLPPGSTLVPGALFVIARNAAAFRAAWGLRADAEFEESEPNTPTLERQRNFATGSWALKDGGDEVVLLNSSGQLLDAVAYGDGDYAALQLTGNLRPPTGYSLQRVPGFEFPNERDVRHRFLAAPARPEAIEPLPLAQESAKPLLDHGLVATWGSLGGQSNFTPGKTAPPHFLAAAAGAQGLNFVALADPYVPDSFSGQQRAVAAGALPVQTLLLPAWSWLGSDDERAFVYESHGTSSPDRQIFLKHVAETESLVQWQGREPPNAPGIFALDGGLLDAIPALKRLEDIWRSADRPLIPAGNSNPQLPGLLDPQPRFTGLVVEANDAASIRRALGARRGWLTSRPGIWLTLGADVPGEGFRWMGERLLPRSELTLDIHYGDLAGEVAGLAIWQNDKPIRQLDLPPVGGRWRVQIPVEDDSFLFAVATQQDGDFAVTAPLQILPNPASDEGDDGRESGGEDSGNNQGVAKRDADDSPSISPSHGQATGPPGSLAGAKIRGLTQWVEFRAVVVAPPGLFNSSMYVAEAAPTVDSPMAGLGIQVYLRNGGYPELFEGDRVLVRGILDTFRGEMELVIAEPGQIWRIEPGAVLQALPVAAAEVGESLEGRLVSFTGMVDGWSRDSIYLLDPDDPSAEAVRVTVRSSVGWRRPYVNEGELWRVTGIVSQFAREEPWNGGYRVLVRYEEDLERVSR